VRGGGISARNKTKFYFDKHLEGEHHSKYIIGGAQEQSFGAVWRDVRPFHGQRNAVKRYKRKHQVVEPFLLDEVPARSPETGLRTRIGSQ